MVLSQPILAGTAAVPFPESGPGSGAPPVVLAVRGPDLDVESTWQRHGVALYLLACALLRDEVRAEHAVAQGITDFCLRPGRAASPDRGADRRELGRIIYWRCSEATAPSLTPEVGTTLPVAMVWLHEAAELLGLPTSTLAALLRTGLLDLAGLASSPN